MTFKPRHGQARGGKSTEYRPALFLTIALAIGSTPAHGKCHLYKYWAYSFPQRCFGQKPVSVGHKIVYPPEDRPDPDIPLPALSKAELYAVEPDEATAARLTLLAYGHARAD